MHSQLPVALRYIMTCESVRNFLLHLPVFCFQPCTLSFFSYFLPPFLPSIIISSLIFPYFPFSSFLPSFHSSVLPSLLSSLLPIFLPSILISIHPSIHPSIPPSKPFCVHSLFSVYLAFLLLQSRLPPFPRFFSICFHLLPCLRTPLSIPFYRPTPPLPSTLSLVSISSVVFLLFYILLSNRFFPLSATVFRKRPNLIRTDS